MVHILLKKNWTVHINPSGNSYNSEQIRSMLIHFPIDIRGLRYHTLVGNITSMWWILTSIWRKVSSIVHLLFETNIWHQLSACWSQKSIFNKCTTIDTMFSVLGPQLFSTCIIYYRKQNQQIRLMAYSLIAECFFMKFNNEVE